MPDHVSYTEAFFAGGAVLFWAEEPARGGTINDVMGTLLILQVFLNTDYSSFKMLVDQTLHSRKEHGICTDCYEISEFFARTAPPGLFWYCRN
jgi:site-specific DNA-adenine methylase